MYAVISTGGKQYRVSVGRYYRFEQLPGADGDHVTFDQVYAIVGGDRAEIGKPFCQGQVVSGKILSQGRGKKIKVLHFKRRKQHMKTKGHRQNYTEIEITAIPGHVAVEAPKASVAVKKEIKPEGAISKKVAPEVEASKAVKKPVAVKKAAVASSTKKTKE